MIIKVDEEGKKLVLALIDLGVRSGSFANLAEANRLAESVELVEDETKN